jgi:DNA-binding beta-propeller fold protein YncE
MLDTRRWAAVLVAVGVWFPAGMVCAGEPQIIQTLTMGENPTSICVSPTGGKVLWCRESALAEHDLLADGRIGARTHLLQEERFWCCTYTPNGKRIVAACTNQVIVVSRSDWANYTVLDTGHVDPRAVSCLEDPRVALVQWRHEGTISVIDYVNPAVLKTIEFTQPGHYEGRGIMAHPDGKRFFRIVWDGTQRFGRIDCMENPTGTLGYPWSLAVGETFCLGLGPDPQHVMVPSSSGRKLHLLDVDTGQNTEWYFFDTDDPVGAAITSDGYYVVVADYPTTGLHIISGHDLRAYLDPNTGMDHEAVRSTIFALPDYPISLALHPTLPIAYVGCQPRKAGDPSKVCVVKLGIPGIDHP